MPRILPTSGERSSAATTDVPISPVGPVIATVSFFAAPGSPGPRFGAVAMPRLYSIDAPARLLAGFSSVTGAVRLSCASASRVHVDRPEPQHVPRSGRAVLRRSRRRPLAAPVPRAALLRPQPDDPLARLLQQPARRLPG